MDSIAKLVVSLGLSFLIWGIGGKKFEFNKKRTIQLGVSVGVIVWFCLLFLNTNWWETLFFSGIFVLIISGIIVVYLFYRDPKRVIPEGENIIVSPADGKVREVREVSIKDIEGFENKVSFTPKSKIVEITMTYLDVHIIRAPTFGEVVFKKYIKGGFFSLKNRTSLYQNHRVLLIIKNPQLELCLTLISSRVVRKILLWKEKGNFVPLGTRIGKIVLGSQVNIILPEKVKIKVKKGEQVYGGSTILGEIIRE